MSVGGDAAVRTTGTGRDLERELIGRAIATTIEQLVKQDVARRTSHGPKVYIMCRMITPLVLTLDEAPNLARCLNQLTWAPRVVVLDSGSTDGTIDIARRFPNVDVHVRTFDNHTNQWNAGVDLVQTPWVLSLDADYILADGFPAALGIVDRAAASGDSGDECDFDAAFASFRYCIAGKPLRASLYPPRAVLFRRDRCRYEADGHTQRLRVPGRSIALAGIIDHDDRKSFSRWFASQRQYARLEARMLRSTAFRDLSWQDRFRRLVLFGPPGALVQAFVLKGAVVSGWRGWYYTLQRVLAETLVSVELMRGN